MYLVRLCDGGHPLPRARVRLDLAGSVPDAARVPGLAALLNRKVTLDPFDRPPQRERIRARAVELTGRGLEQRQVAAHADLGEPATQTAVSDAPKLDRRIRELGLPSPYVVLDGPPDDYPKLRRHPTPSTGSSRSKGTPGGRSAL